MELMSIWHPKYGELYDIFLTLEEVKIEQEKIDRGEDIPFSPPPEEYSYRCSHCHCEMKVNEVIIDVEIGIAEFEGRYHEGFMPVLGCPNCN